MKQLFLILAFVLYIPLQVAGQVHYPIRTTTVVTPPVPFSLDGFVSQPGKLMLNIMVDDVTLSQYPVKLLLHIEGNGIRISTNPNLALQPVYIDGGMVTQLTGPDLEAYFNPENLIFQGYSLSEYRRNGRLPEGVYRIRFEVLDYYRGFQISSAIPAVAMLSLTNAPVLTFPVNRSEVDVDANPVFRFSWMAVFTAIPEAMIEYRFRLWLIRPDNRDPYEITRVTTPIYDEIVTETALLYDGSLPPLIRGSRYVWQVTAIDRVGKVLFKNNGDSDIFTFIYGCKCEAPSALISKVSHNSVSVSWNSNPSVNEYIVNYRAENASEWNKVSTRTIGYTIDNLKHSTNYEVQVKANCGEETSDNERVLHFKTDRFVDYTCGAGAPVFSFDNREPLPILNKYDEFKASDFYIEVTEVRGANGIFSGRGLASVPLLNFLKFEVAFNDITINTDRQMIDGKVVFVYDEATGMIIGGDMGYGKSESDDETDTEAYNYEEALDYISDQTVSLDEEIKEVTVNNGVVKVVTESGQTKTYKVGENETLAVVTPEGVTVVDQASGRVFQTTKESPGSSSGVRTSSQSGIHGCMVDFRPIEGQRFGFDAVGNGIVKPDNYFLRDRDGSSIPWKSLEAGNTDRVSMLSTGDCSSDSLRFIRESGILTPTTPGKNNSIELLLTGGFAGQEERLTVARATTKHINDSTTNEILTEAGVLGLVTYSREIKNVVLVPVNSSSFPSAGTDLSVVAKRLNEIYSPAVVNWHVSYDHAIEVGKVNEEDFKVEGTSMLSKYTPDMNKVIRKYKRERPTDDNTMYLFFLNIPDLGSNRKGFMPLAGNYGFIFNFGTDLELLAHELAHGAFNLRHTFSDKAQYYFPQNQTANLLDYAGGTELWKYQWDLIHNPEKILFSWAQDEEEGAMIATSDKDSINVSITKLNAEFAPGIGELEIEYSLDKQTRGIISKYPNEDFNIILAIADEKGNIVYTLEQKAEGKATFAWNGYKDKEQKQPVLFDDGPYKVNVSLTGGKKVEGVSDIRTWQELKDVFYQKFYGDSLMYITASVDTTFNILNDPVKLDWLVYNESFIPSKNESWYVDFVASCKANGYFTDSIAKPMEWLMNKGVLNTSASFCGQTVSGILPELAEMINLADNHLKTNHPTLHARLISERKYIPGPNTGVSMRYIGSGPSLHSFGASVDFRPTYNPYITSGYAVIAKYIKHLSGFDVLKGPKTPSQSYNASKTFLEKLHGKDWISNGNEHRKIIEDYEKLNSYKGFAIDSLSNIINRSVCVSKYEDRKYELLGYLELSRKRIVFEDRAIEGLDLLIEHLAVSSGDTIASLIDSRLELFFKEYQVFKEKFGSFEELAASLNAQFETVKSNRILMHGFCDIEPEVYEAFNEAHKIISKRLLKKELNVDAGIIYNSSIDAMHFGLSKELVQYLTNNP